jgi:hypothetical protein
LPKDTGNDDRMVRLVLDGLHHLERVGGRPGWGVILLGGLEHHE